MKRTLLLFNLWLTAAGLAMPAAADVTTRALSMFTAGDRLLILGTRLPAGPEVMVRLGDRYLDVISAEESLVVARLPAVAPKGDVSLVVQRGVQRIVFDQPALQWGLLVPLQ
jgi:hypothetical protein